MTGLFPMLMASLGFSPHDQPIPVHPVEARPVLYSYVELVDRLTNWEPLPYWYLASGGSDAYKALPLSRRTDYYVPPN
jgi:hypothetical protein